MYHWQKLAELVCVSAIFCQWKFFVSGFAETCAASRYGWVVWRSKTLKSWKRIQVDQNGQLFLPVLTWTPLNIFQPFTLCTQGPVSLARVEELCAEAEEGH